MILNDAPWFVGKDLAQVLGCANPQEAVRTHVDDEDRTVTVLGTVSGPKETANINESGLYSLILSSTLPNAKKFKWWGTTKDKRESRFATPVLLRF